MRPVRARPYKLDTVSTIARVDEGEPAPTVHVAARPQPWLAVLAVAVLLDCCGILALGVVAAEALAIVRSVDRGQDFPGLLTTAFFLVGSATAATLGRRLDRVGARRTAVASAATTALVALPLMWLSTSSVPMVVGSGVAGAAFSLTLPATNALLGASLPSDRLVLGVCVKQAAIPTALLLVTAAAPLLGGGGPSRAFLGADVLALLVLVAFVIVTRGTSDVSARPRGETVPGPLPEGIVRHAAATMLASLLAGALIGYGAISLHGAGLAEHEAARALALGSLAGIGVRVLSGWLSQRLGLTSWWPVSAMTWSGAVGALCLTSDRAAVSVAGLLIAFALGWGWSGLAFALVLVVSGDRSGAAGAALQSGGMLGSALGPLMMSGAVHASGLTAGWVVVAVAMLAAGLLFMPRR
jgi:hypothetical protein